jgi:UDP-glucuronate decarboxylase
MSILQLAHTIIKITNSNSTVTHLPPLKEGDMLRRRLDISKMLQILARNPIGLNEGIQRTLLARALG